MGDLELRFRNATGERYLKNGKVRCQGSSKLKIKQLRIKYGDPELTKEDLWPECQCTWAAEEGTFGCHLHNGGNLNNNKKVLADWMPIDLREKLQILEANKDQIFNRDNEIAQLIARNAQLYESMDELVLGEEAYSAVAEARKSLASGDAAAAALALDIALRDVRTEREVMQEMRENIKLIDKMTITQFNIRKDLKLMATIDQVKGLLEGMYRGFESIASEYIPDDKMRAKAVYQFATLIRDLANARHVTTLGDGR